MNPQLQQAGKDETYLCPILDYKRPEFREIQTPKVIPLSPEPAIPEREPAPLEAETGKLSKGVKRVSYKDRRISAFEDYTPPPPLLSFGDMAVGTRGNFIMVTGKPKSKKTFLISALITAVLVGMYGNIKCAAKGRVLAIDTEQGKGHCHNVLKRIGKATGLSKEELEERLFFIGIREDDTKTRLELIEEAIEAEAGNGIDFIVLDGLKDLLFDINSANESTEIIDKLMQWSQKNDVLIACVLHENKINDQLRGHIGTEAQNKAETVIQVEKVSATTSKVAARACRNEEFEPFEFTIDENGLLSFSDLQPKEKAIPLQFDLNIIRNIADGTFREHEMYGSKVAFNIACQEWYFRVTKKTIGDKNTYKLIERMEQEKIVTVNRVNARKIEFTKNKSYVNL